MLRKPLAALVLSACCVKSDPVPVPPPIAGGRCLVAHWIGGLAADQTCQLGGYSWHCVADPAKAGRDQQRDRGPEVGEAPPHAVAAGSAR